MRTGWALPELSELRQQSRTKKSKILHDRQARVGISHAERSNHLLKFLLVLEHEKGQEAKACSINTF
jgi:hypothetical protein